MVMSSCDQMRLMYVCMYCILLVTVSVASLNASTHHVSHEACGIQNRICDSCVITFSHKAVQTKIHNTHCVCQCVFGGSMAIQVQTLIIPNMCQGRLVRLQSVRKRQAANTTNIAHACGVCIVWRARSHRVSLLVSRVAVSYTVACMRLLRTN